MSWTPPPDGPELRAVAPLTSWFAAARAAVVRHRLQAATARARPVEGPEPSWPADDRASLGRDPHPELYRATLSSLSVA